MDMKSDNTTATNREKLETELNDKSEKGHFITINANTKELQVADTTTISSIAPPKFHTPGFRHNTIWTEPISNNKLWVEDFLPDPLAEKSDKESSGDKDFDCKDEKAARNGVLIYEKDAK